jgi:hypothetical protein
MTPELSTGPVTAATAEAPPISNADPAIVVISTVRGRIPFMIPLFLVPAGWPATQEATVGAESM